MRAALAAAVFLACSSRPPESVTIDSAFDDQQRAEIEDGLAQWCAAVGHCPEQLSDGGELQIRAAHGRASGADTYHEWISGDFEIVVDMGKPFMSDAENGLWRVVAHELGHTGAGGDHTPGGLMRASQPWSGPRCIDQAAVDLWCAEQLCFPNARGTCED